MNIEPFKKSDPLTAADIQIDESKGKDEGKENQTANLESNPKPILEDYVKDK